MEEKTGKSRQRSRGVGQVVKRGENKWLVRIYRGTDAVGKRDYYNKTIRGTKKDAGKWLTAALRRLDLGEPIEESDLSFGVFFEQWLKNRSKTIKESTLKNYSKLANRHILPRLKSRPLAGVTSSDLQRIFNDLADLKLSNGTIALIRTILSGGFRHAF